MRSSGTMPESAVAVADIKIAVRAQKTAKSIEFMKRAMAQCDSISVDQLAKAALLGTGGDPGLSCWAPITQSGAEASGRVSCPLLSAGVTTASSRPSARRNIRHFPWARLWRMYLPDKMRSRQCGSFFPASRIELPEGFDPGKGKGNVCIR